MDQGGEDTDTFSPPAPAQKKRGPKKKGRRNQVRHVKQKGLYEARQRKGFASAQDEADLVECLFSDDEVRDDFLKLTEADSDSVASIEFSDSSCASSVVSADSSVTDSDASRSSALSSRPSSSLSSRPSSALSSRPSSALSLSRPSSSFTRNNTAVPTEDKTEECETVQFLDEGLEVTNEAVLCDPSVELIQSGLERFKNILPFPWYPIADKEGFHLLCISLVKPKAVQREIFLSYHGNVIVSIHRKTIPYFKEIFKLDKPSVNFDEKTLSEYCMHGFSLVQHCLRFKVCVGADDIDTRAVWDRIQDSCIDVNPYGESEYSETCRSLSCVMLVELGHGKRCVECSKLLNTIRHRKKFLLSETANPLTNNRNLTFPQALKKLEQQHEDIRKKDKQITYLKSRISAMIESEGVNIDEDISETFTKILMDNPNLTEVQRMFLSEQWAICNKSDSRAHRWHPTMIRFALSIYMNSPGNYDRMRDAGVLRLPHSRTLFNYTHSIKAKGGINDELVNLIQAKVASFDEDCKKYHVLLCDGMHVSQNLVFRESDGTLVGYSDLDDVDKEIERLEKYVVGKEPVPNERILATEVVAYLVKGMASDVKCVVASYATKVMTKEMLYTRSWEVIRHLETAGIKILAFVADGHPVNRAFFQMHKPAHGPTKFGGVYATFNFCAPEERLLFFISDVCHLIKTLRNSFYNSGDGEKKPRLLERNGQTIVWRHIVRLYLAFKNNTFRKSYKLNAQNVFPTSYSKMKVKFAVQILSTTVALLLESLQWEGTAETIKFIRNCNKFFDCLNGAHSTQGRRTRNPDLEPYTAETVKEDQRFVWLLSFVNDLYEWKKEVDRIPIASDLKEKKLLPLQTMLGIEMSINAIKGATEYFLDPEKGKGKFLNARIFSQDPLEQHFGAQRCGRGGSRNPNVSQFQQKQVATALQRDLGVRKRKANSSEAEVGLQLSSDPVPRLKRQRKK